MHDLLLGIGLSSWIIQDGNYPDFECGTTSQFALEFYSEHGLSVGNLSPRLKEIRDAKYEATGVVRFCADGVWIVDFDGVLAFRDGSPPQGIFPGTVVSGEIYLGVDPFFYFESHYKVPGIPPLIYTWQIEGIAMETAPFVESTDSLGRKVLVRDDKKLRRVSIAKTDAWNDDNGNADYLLTCRSTGAPLSKRLGNAR